MFPKYIYKLLLCYQIFKGVIITTKMNNDKHFEAYDTLVQFFGAIENQTLHGQDFCDELRTSWSVTLQYSRSFVCTI